MPLYDTWYCLNSQSRSSLRLSWLFSLTAGLLVLSSPEALIPQGRVRLRGLFFFPSYFFSLTFLFTEHHYRNHMIDRPATSQKHEKGLTLTTTKTKIGFGETFQGMEMTEAEARDESHLVCVFSFFFVLNDLFF